MWVRARCTIHNSVPIALARAAEKEGFGSGTAIARHYLQLAIKGDLGIDVPMPKAKQESHFGGKINEVGDDLSRPRPMEPRG